MAAFSDLDFGFKIAQRATEYGVDGLLNPAELWPSPLSFMKPVF